MTLEEEVAHLKRVVAVLAAAMGAVPANEVDDALLAGIDVRVRTSIASGNVTLELDAAWPPNPLP